jgi:hypothetical protein
LQRVWQALNTAQIQFATNQATIQQGFYPSDSLSVLARQELLNAFSTTVGVVGALANIPVAGGGAELIKGIIGGIALTILPPNDQSVIHLSEIES